MSIATSLQKLETDITNAYNTINTKGGTIPSDKNTNNLATAINSIPSGGSATLITKSITQNGTYNASSDNADGYSQVTVNVSGGGTVEPEEKDVNFYDYDGTRVYSYTKAEFLALQSMPENPTHTGLTAQGWNWALSDAQSYIPNVNILEIGQNYITDDGKTRLYVKLIESTLNLNLRFGVYGGSTNYIDWGDGSERTTLVANSKTTLSSNHSYSEIGEYVITIETTSGDGIFFVGNSNSGSSLLSKTDGSTIGYSYPNRPYIETIKKIEMGKVNHYDCDVYSFMFLGGLETISISRTTSNSNISRFNFNGCSFLKFVVIPSNVLELSGNSTFAACRAMKKISFPKNITLNNYAFNGCWNLENIPNNLTKLPTNGFQYTYRAKSVKFGKNVTTIETYAINACGAKVFDFTNNTTVPTLAANNFKDGPSDYEIWVPASLYDTWKTRTNWSSISSHIVSK